MSALVLGSVAVFQRGSIFFFTSNGYKNVFSNGTKHLFINLIIYSWVSVYTGTDLCPLWLVASLLEQQQQQQWFVIKTFCVSISLSSFTLTACDLTVCTLAHCRCSEWLPETCTRGGFNLSKCKLKDFDSKGSESHASPSSERRRRRRRKRWKRKRPLSSSFRLFTAEGRATFV